MFRQPKYTEPILFQYKDIYTDHSYWATDEEVANLINELPEEILRKSQPTIPDLPEYVVVKHFTRLSRMNYAIDLGPYPLGSCTMKYNPKYMEKLYSIKNLALLHDQYPIENCQGMLELLYMLDQYLCEITGMNKFSFQPAAGAHGELTGVLIIKKYHEINGDKDLKNEIIVPDSAHGTNPASAAMANFKVLTVKSNEFGTIDIEQLKSLVSRKTAGLMLTNPNTLGLFEKDVLEISKIIHEVGGLLYYDGANLNGIMCYCRPGDMGFDIVHLNLHKTFATPHGGGGPGAGPVGVKSHLIEFLPVPIVEKEGNYYFLKYDLKHTIGRVRENFGNSLVLLKALAYILSKGYEGLKEARDKAVYNTQHFISLMKDVDDISLTHDKKVMRFHECLFSASKLAQKTGITAKDVAKRLFDYGLHPPMIYFPLIVDEAMLFEFTEDETLENIEKYAHAIKQIIKEAYTNPEIIKNSPSSTSISRLNEVKASHPRTMILSWKFIKDKKTKPV